MSFLARFVSDNSGSLEKLELEAPFSPATLKKKFFTGSEFLFVATYASDLTFVALSTSEILVVSPNREPITLIMGHPCRGSRVVPLDSTGMIPY